MTIWTHQVGKTAQAGKQYILTMASSEGGNDLMIGNLLATAGTDVKLTVSKLISLLLNFMHTLSKLTIGFIF